MNLLKAYFYFLCQGLKTEGQHSCQILCRIRPLRGSSATLGHRWVIYSAKLKCSCAGKFFYFYLEHSLDSGCVWLITDDRTSIMWNVNQKCDCQMFFFLIVKYSKSSIIQRHANIFEMNDLWRRHLEAVITCCGAHGVKIHTLTHFNQPTGQGGKKKKKDLTATDAHIRAKWRRVQKLIFWL